MPMYTKYNKIIFKIILGYVGKLSLFNLLNLSFFIGFFGSNLPDYQRSEIMMFIMGKVPVFGTSTHTLDISQLG
jgi:hypothetical protein